MQTPKSVETDKEHAKIRDSRRREFYIHMHLMGFEGFNKFEYASNKSELTGEDFSNMSAVNCAKNAKEANKHAENLPVYMPKVLHPNSKWIIVTAKEAASAIGKSWVFLMEHGDGLCGEADAKSRTGSFYKELAGKIKELDPGATE